MANFFPQSPWIGSQSPVIPVQQYMDPRYRPPVQPSYFSQLPADQRTAGMNQLPHIANRLGADVGRMRPPDPVIGAAINALGQPAFPAPMPQQGYGTPDLRVSDNTQMQPNIGPGMVPQPGYMGQPDPNNPLAQAVAAPAQAGMMAGPGMVPQPGYTNQPGPNIFAGIANAWDRYVNQPVGDFIPNQPAPAPVQQSAPAATPTSAPAQQAAAPALTFPSAWDTPYAQGTGPAPQPPAQAQVAPASAQAPVQAAAPPVQAQMAPPMPAQGIPGYPQVQVEEGTGRMIPVGNLPPPIAGSGQPAPQQQVAQTAPAQAQPAPAQQQQTAAPATNNQQAPIQSSQAGLIPQYFAQAAPQQAQIPTVNQPMADMARFAPQQAGGPGTTITAQEPGAFSRFGQLMGDPAVQNMLANAGAAISSPGSFGNRLGQSTAQMTQGPMMSAAANDPNSLSAKMLAPELQALNRQILASQQQQLMAEQMAPFDMASKLSNVVNDLKRTEILQNQANQPQFFNKGMYDPKTEQVKMFPEPPDYQYMAGPDGQALEINKNARSARAIPIEGWKEPEAKRVENFNKLHDRLLKVRDDAIKFSTPTSGLVQPNGAAGPQMQWSKDQASADQYAKQEVMRVLEAEKPNMSEEDYQRMLQMMGLSAPNKDEDELRSLAQ